MKESCREDEKEYKDLSTSRHFKLHYVGNCFITFKKLVGLLGFVMLEEADV